jgi:hypothetical protein
MAPCPALPLLSAAHAPIGTSSQKALSDAFAASMVCLQVISMVAFADAFVAMSTHALRVWSMCVLYIARSASGTSPRGINVPSFGEIMGNDVMTSWRPPRSAMDGRWHVAARLPVPQTLVLPFERFLNCACQRAGSGR